MRGLTILAVTSYFIADNLLAVTDTNNAKIAAAVLLIIGVILLRLTPLFHRKFDIIMKKCPKVDRSCCDVALIAITSSKVNEEKNLAEHTSDTILNILGTITELDAWFTAATRLIGTDCTYPQLIGYFVTYAVMIAAFAFYLIFNFFAYSSSDLCSESPQSKRQHVAVGILSFSAIILALLYIFADNEQPLDCLETFQCIDKSAMTKTCLNNYIFRMVFLGFSFILWLVLAIGSTIIRCKCTEQNNEQTEIN